MIYFSTGRILGIVLFIFRLDVNLAIFVENNKSSDGWERCTRSCFTHNTVIQEKCWQDVTFCNFKRCHLWKTVSAMHLMAFAYMIICLSWGSSVVSYTHQAYFFLIRFLKITDPLISLLLWEAIWIARVLDEVWQMCLNLVSPLSTTCNMCHLMILFFLATAIWLSYSLFLSIHRWRDR